MSIKNGTGGKATEAATKWRWLYRQLFQVEASKAIYEQRRIQKIIRLISGVYSPVHTAGALLTKEMGTAACGPLNLWARNLERIFLATIFIRGGELHLDVYMRLYV
ncbi:hypothetical protein CDAR_309691 [Caerostris darwini]|uniref:Uncharacterized protein n=1 Tax=Caerostris darwini TaxID=1538125 RepID=A0AAV4VX27_9ARAC|nr:hypothetical protein CDAR_309691 [Caerostris darwini]